MDFVVSHPSQNTRRMGHPACALWTSSFPTLRKIREGWGTRLARYGLRRFPPFTKYAKDGAPGVRAMDFVVSHPSQNMRRMGHPAPGVDQEVHATAGQEAGATCCFPALPVVSATGNIEPSRRSTLYQQANCSQGRLHKYSYRGRRCL